MKVELGGDYKYVGNLKSNEVFGKRGWFKAKDNGF